MGDLLKYFHGSPHRLMIRHADYFPVYERHFAHFRNKPVTVLEFGVFNGGSLQMWKHYFGRQARVIGVDINPECADLVEPQIEIYIGDQGNRKFLRKLGDAIGAAPDIVIDDGGHRYHQQIATFEEFFPRLKSPGLYMTEDTHTSYERLYGGGRRVRGTFMEYAKQFVDYQYVAGAQLSASAQWFYRNVGGVHFYRNMVVVEKRRMPDAEILKAGEQAIGADANGTEWQGKRVVRRAARAALDIVRHQWNYKPWHKIVLK